MKLLFCGFLLFSLSACVPAVRFTSGQSGFSDISKTGDTAVPPAPVGQVFRGFASFYGDEFQGRQTSNGEIFDQNEWTAAHKTFPFGTVLRVKNLKNGRSTTVRINDRGPFKESRILDLSRSAATELGMIQDGVVEVEITVIQ